MSKLGKVIYIQKSINTITKKKGSKIMFNNSKYTKWYFNIIKNARERKDVLSYYEKHHIIPKSLGGDNAEKNIIALSAKEHYICHHLLTKMCKNKKDIHKMNYAYFFMHTNPSKIEERYYTSRSYEYSKLLMSETKRENSIGEKNHFYGKSHNKKTKDKMSKSWNKSAERNVDKTVYTFYHEEHGTEICTRKELCEKYNISHKRIYTIVSKLYKTTNGWRVIWENEATL